MGGVGVVCVVCVLNWLKLDKMYQIGTDPCVCVCVCVCVVCEWVYSQDGLVCFVEPIKEQVMSSDVMIHMREHRASRLCRYIT